MCGIIVSNSPICEQMRKMVTNRGPDLITETKINDFTFISTTLSIRDHSTKKNSKNILLYNGEIYNDTPSDTDFLHECLENIPKCTECFCIVKKVYDIVNKCENEVAICFYSDNSIYFFKDDVGRRSFGFTITNLFYAGSIGFETEADSNFLYQYRIRDHKLLCVPKDKSITCQIGVEYHQDRISHNIILRQQEVIHVKWGKSEDLKFQAHILENLLIQSCKRRMHRFDNVLFFGGGIDSLIIAITLNKVVEKNRPIYLVNTSFDGEMSWDRLYGLKNYHALCDILKERKYVFVRNDISLEEVKCALPIVKKLIYPKISIMDLNIGLCHYFSAKKAQNYTKVVYTGMGADELFGGYSKYSKKMTSARCAIDHDVAAIYKDNIGRDDRVVADNAVEMRSPFLDKDVIKFALSLDIKYLVNTGESADKGCSKAILRELLTLQGFKTESKIDKKAVQFGSGLKKMEKEYK